MKDRNKNEIKDKNKIRIKERKETNQRNGRKK